MPSRPLHDNHYLLQDVQEAVHVHDGQSLSSDHNRANDVQSIVVAHRQVHAEHEQSTGASCCTTVARNAEHAQCSTGALDFEFCFGLRPAPPVLAQGGHTSNGLRPAPPEMAQGGCSSRNFGLDDPEGDLRASDSD